MSDKLHPNLLSNMISSVEKYTERYVREYGPICIETSENGETINKLEIALIRIKAMVSNWTHVGEDEYGKIYLRIVDTKLSDSKCQVMTDWLMGGSMWLRMSHTQTEIEDVIEIISGAIGGLSDSVLVPDEIAAEAVNENTVSGILTGCYWALFFFLFSHSEYN